MKKLVIAGSAVAAIIAAVPLAGSFAIQDNLTVNIGEACTLDRTSGTGSYTKTMQLNSFDQEFGTSTYRVICNNAHGFSVAAAFTDLDDSGDGENITYSATTPTAGSGTWTAYNTTINPNNPTETLTPYNIDPSSSDTNAKTLMNYSGVTPADGYTATVVYKVSTRNNQAQGSYVGNATYTLNKNQ